MPKKSKLSDALDTLLDLKEEQAASRLEKDRRLIQTLSQNAPTDREPDR